MRSLSDYKGEEAIEVIADLLPPIVEMCQDPDFVAMAKDDGLKLKKMKLVQYILKNHAKRIIEIFAVLDREDPTEYADKVNLVTLPLKLMGLFNDPEFSELFQSQGQTGDAKSFGSVSENTADQKQ